MVSFSQNPSSVNQARLVADLEQGIDDLIDNTNTKSLAFITGKKGKNDEMDIEVIDIQDNPEKVVRLIDEKRVVILQNDPETKKTKVKFDPVWQEKLKNVKQLNLKDAHGKTKSIRTNEIGSTLILGIQSEKEIRAIARIHDVALKIIESKKKEEAKKEEKLGGQEEGPYAGAQPSKVNLQERKVEKIDTSEPSPSTKPSRTALLLIERAALEKAQKKTTTA